MRLAKVPGVPRIGHAAGPGGPIALPVDKAGVQPMTAEGSVSALCQRDPVAGYAMTINADAVAR